MASQTQSGNNFTQVGSGLDWTYLSNSSSSDDTYVFGASDGITPTKVYVPYSFGFSIPSNAVIDGIEANVEKKQVTFYDCQDLEVKLYNNGLVGDNKANATDWPSSDTVVTYGGSSDMWGTSLTAADINSTDFGFGISAENIEGAGNSEPQIDHVEITVYYTAPTPSLNDITSIKGATNINL